MSYGFPLNGLDDVWGIKEYISFLCMQNDRKLVYANWKSKDILFKYWKVCVVVNFMR